MVIASSVAVLVAGCGSDNNSANATTTGSTTGSTATSTGTSPPVATESVPASTVAPTSSGETSSPNPGPTDEPFTPELQAHLDQINDGSIVEVDHVCTTIDGKVYVPVLVKRGELLVSTQDQQSSTARDALDAFLTARGLDPTTVVTAFEGYTDGMGRFAAGLFLAALDGVTFDSAFMTAVQAFNANAAPNGTLISLNFLYSMSQVWRFHPFGSPEGVQTGPSDSGSGGTDRRIAVFDSLYPETFPSLGVTSPHPAVDDITVQYPATAPPHNGPLTAVGHGPFVTMLIQRFAPSATVEAWGIAQGIDPDGVFVTVGDVQTAMSRAFAEDRDPNQPDFKGFRPDVINLSFGGAGCELAAPAVFGEFLKRLVTPGEWTGAPENVPVVVAAAGNSSADVLEYPAAFPNVVAVGSITNDAPDCFSNVGDWIDIWGPGADQISYYPYGTGWAKWSGTSFATARVSAMLATHNDDHAVPILDVWQQAQSNPPTGFSVQRVTTPTACP